MQSFIICVLFVVGVLGCRGEKVENETSGASLSRENAMPESKKCMQGYIDKNPENRALLALAKDFIDIPNSKLEDVINSPKFDQIDQEITAYLEKVPTKNDDDQGQGLAESSSRDPHNPYTKDPPSLTKQQATYVAIGVSVLVVGALAGALVPKYIAMRKDDRSRSGKWKSNDFYNPDRYNPERGSGFKNSKEETESSKERAGRDALREKYGSKFEDRAKIAGAVGIVASVVIGGVIASQFTGEGLAETASNEKNNELKLVECLAKAGASLRQN